MITTKSNHQAFNTSTSPLYQLGLNVASINPMYHQALEAVLNKAAALETALRIALSLSLTHTHTCTWCVCVCV